MSDDDTSSWLVSNAAKLLGLIFGYAFLSGWSFLDSYFRFFGMDPKSLDIGFYDILIKGFTILFSESRLRILSDTSSIWLSYIALLVIPIFLEEKLKTSLKVRAGMIFFFGTLFLLVYFVARRAGEERARLDTGERTRLPGITFKVQNQTYHGKLVIFRGGTYFIHGVAPIAQISTAVELSIYRAEELKEVKVTEHQ